MYSRILLMILLTGVSSLLWADKLSAEQEVLIEEAVSRQLKNYIASDAFQEAVDLGIIRFIEEQNRQRAQSEAQAIGRKAEAVLPITDQDYIYGIPDARYTLIEYSDFECPFCKKFHPIAEAFVEQNLDVNWVYRHFPLDFHNPGAQKQAEASECAGEQAGNRGYWDYSRKIFERTRSNGSGFALDRLTPLAVELGMDGTAFQECLDSERYRKKVRAQYAQGQQAGVTGTPGNFLVDTKTGKIVPISGAQPLEKLNQALAQLKGDK